MAEIPNYIANQISIQNDDTQQTRLKRVAAFLQPEGEPLGFVDFNRLIPMSESLNIYQDFIEAYTLAGILDKDLSQIPKSREEAFLQAKRDFNHAVDPKEWELGKAAWNNIQKYGAPTWYEWSIEHWGTKWNACECTPLNLEANAILFSTAWNGVPKIMAALSRQFPEQRFRYQWADENIGYNVGEQIYENGRVIQDFCPEPGSKEAYELAAGIWDMNLEEYGFHLSKDKTAYEYRDPEEQVSIPIKPAAQKKKERTRGDSR